MVVDVGAGTTDFSLFWVVQSVKDSFRSAFKVEPCSDAIRMAGDIVDTLLLDHIIACAHGASSETVRKKLQADLRLRSLRRLKERLFKTGTLEVPLVTDQVVKIERGEFEQLPQVQEIAGQIQKAIRDFLGHVHLSWAKATGGALMVLTGGSAKLPMIQALARQSWSIGGESFHFAAADELPEVIAATFDLDFQEEYPQLAVAIGGALPVLDEKRLMKEWLGGTPPPGRLERYQTTGI
jgi:molecular chaperone HscA